MWQYNCICTWNLILWNMHNCLRGLLVIHFFQKIHRLLGWDNLGSPRNAHTLRSRGEPCSLPVCWPRTEPRPRRGLHHPGGCHPSTPRWPPPTRRDPRIPPPLPSTARSSSLLSHFKNATDEATRSGLAAYALSQAHNLLTELSSPTKAPTIYCIVKSGLILWKKLAQWGKFWKRHLRNFQ